MAFRLQPADFGGQEREIVSEQLQIVLNGVQFLLNWFCDGLGVGVLDIAQGTLDRIQTTFPKLQDHQQQTHQ
jgi:hypothetical protein